MFAEGIFMRRIGYEGIKVVGLFALLLACTLFKHKWIKRIHFEFMIWIQRNLQ